MLTYLAPCSLPGCLVMTDRVDAGEYHAATTQETLKENSEKLIMIHPEDVARSLTSPG